jgi:hypothetical protein
MAVEIRLSPLFILSQPQGNEGSLELPKVEISSSGTNSPYISRITCTVNGLPSNLAQKIQASYPDFHTNTPRKLDQRPQRLKQDVCKWAQPLPPDVDCTLQVNVQYFDSDQSLDKPVLSAPKNVAASCHLVSSDSLRKTPAINDSGGLLVTESSHSTKAGINIESTTPNSSRLVKEFPGWLAIDFGTSNSTVTLFDTRKVPSLKTLPKEQEERLREHLMQWLSLPASEALPDVDSETWENFRKDVSFSGDRLLLSIRQLELVTASQSTNFRRALSNKLNQIYHQVFRVPPLEWQSLIPVILDPTRKAIEISSELEIADFGDPLEVNMGERANKNRNKALAETDPQSSDQIKGKFHHSPKRYLGEERDFTVILNGKQQKVNAKQLIQSAWAHLVKLTDDYRKDNPGRFAEGPFDRVVVTYPTKASPSVRRDIDTLFHELGVSQVQTAYDEAVSVAIFFLWREFGGDLSLGIESFKTRCQKVGEKQWFQNALVLDIGGGTTDIALINLKLEEQDPFEPGEDRGAGGRYYVLTPKLLRSSGHPQLGGELITLRLFRLLKLAVADCLLTAITEHWLDCNDLENLISGLADRFLDNNRYRSHSLVEALAQEGDTAYQDALSAGERIFPTRWDGITQRSAQRMQTFYTLWQYAEDAKLHFAQRLRRDSDLAVVFELSEKEISDLLRQVYSNFQVHQPELMRIQLNSKQFECAATPVIREAIGIAKGLVVTQFGEQDPYVSASNGLSERIDWLILSGKTCNLHLVESEIYQEFSDYEHFVWNPERVTFVPEFTKLATSAGACYAERLRQYGFNLMESKDILRKGANQLDIDVKNLFYFLPCAFRLKTSDTKELPEIFQAGEKLQQFDFDGHESLLKLRTKTWRGIQLTTTIYRQDYKNGELMLWGNFNAPIQI